MPNEREARLANLQEQIAARLKPVCENWPDDMFEEMVRGLAALTYKYESVDPAYDPQPTEQMIAAMKALAAESAELREKIQRPGET